MEGGVHCQFVDGLNIFEHVKGFDSHLPVHLIRSLYRIVFREFLQSNAARITSDAVVCVLATAPLSRRTLDRERMHRFYFDRRPVFKNEQF